MLRNLIIDTATGRYLTGAPLGADIVDVVVRADAYGKVAQQVGAIYLFQGTLAAAHCSAWMGITGGPDTATAELILQDLDTGANLVTLIRKGVPGPASPASDLTIEAPGWYALWLRATNLKATASVYGLHLVFEGSV
jgi:hypothetical protein